LNAKIRGVIFDLDGTLVDSHLDFDAMRREMRFPFGSPILEALDEMPDERAASCRALLQHYEMDAAEKATLQDGVVGFLELLDARGIHRAVVTRNRSDAAKRTLQMLKLNFEIVITREDGPVKPDPWAIQHICRAWRIKAQDALVIGDFHFDIESGRRAGSRTMLLTHGRDAAELQGTSEPDYIVDSFVEAARILSSR
jgi:HAD superfamily hydrolase (TIGR01549 family)